MHFWGIQFQKGRKTKQLIKIVAISNLFLAVYYLPFRSEVIWLLHVWSAVARRCICRTWPLVSVTIDSWDTPPFKELASSKRKFWSVIALPASIESWCGYEVQSGSLSSNVGNSLRPKLWSCSFLISNSTHVDVNFCGTAASHGATYSNLV